MHGERESLLHGCWGCCVLRRREEEEEERRQSSALKHRRETTRRKRTHHKCIFYKRWVRPKRCHHKRNEGELHLSSCSHHLAPTIGPSRSCLGLLYMGGLLSRRGASVRLASWNVAAVNNNPFEYYTTLADPR